MVNKAALVLHGLLTFFILSLFTNTTAAQPVMNNYEKEWKKVDILFQEKGLPKSALEEVNKIYASAKKNKQDAQMIKALSYKLILQEQITENPGIKAILETEAELAVTREPAKSILNNLLASHYWSYFQRYRWQLYNRTETVNFKKEDIATWSVGDFHRKVGQLYLASLKDGKLLQQTKLEGYEAIIIKGTARYLRPTLYDLLAHRALEYFVNDERDLAKPAYAFEIKEDIAFAPAAEFAAYRFTTKDENSLHFKAIQIYQELLRFHLNDDRPDALIDTDLARIGFVRQYGVMANKDALYKKALEQLTNTYKEAPVAAQAWFLLADWYAGKATSYNPLKDSVLRMNYIIAKDICDKVMKQTSASEGKVNCQNLLRQIRQRELRLQTEKVNLPDQPFRTLVQYRNFNTLHLRLVPFSQALKNNLEKREDDEDAYWKKLVAQEPLRAWKQSLPETGDYQKHFTEIKIDALTAGEYVLIASANDNFSMKENLLAVQFFYVSAISFVNNGPEYFVLHRETGQPLEGARIQSYHRFYDYKQSKYIDTKGEEYLADNNGYFKLKKNKAPNDNTVRLAFSYKNDQFSLGDYVYPHYYYDGENPAILNNDGNANRIFFFTDRSIYRPGQTVFFKGIAIQTNGNTKKTIINNNFSSTVQLLDANGQEVNKLLVKANEYGSFSGTFKLPDNLLNGNFRLHEINAAGDVNFSVEEYKRPKFYVDYEKVKGSYRVNDSINVIGFAKGYAGNNIDGANVKYRVVREARFMNPWMFWRWGTPSVAPMEITNGEMITDASGKFNINFAALPDLSIDKATDPIFDYKVYADITDINGETRSGETVIPVGYKSLVMTIAVPGSNTIPADSLKKLTVNTNNLSGAFEPATVNITMHRLLSPDKLTRNRFWQQPDQFVMTKEAYAKHFPYDEYRDEANYQAWPKEADIFTGSFSTKENIPFDLPATAGKLQPGIYVIEAITKDKYGEQVKAIEYVTLYNANSNTLPVMAFNWSHISKSEAGSSTPLTGFLHAEPGETVNLSAASSAGEVYLVQQVDKMNKQSEFSFSSISNEKKIFNFPVTETDRGGFMVTYLFVKQNRFYSARYSVQVPWSNKELAISYETYRDKTLPGSEEKWKVKISGYKGEKVAAEMLASMYDASLDQFKPHAWEKPYLWPYFNGSTNWAGNACFTTIDSREKWMEQETGGYFDKRYDALLWLDPQEYDYNRRGVKFAQKSVRVEAAMEAPSAVTTMSYMFSTNNRSSVADSVKAGFDKEEKSETPTGPGGDVQIRKNFNETAFFFPDLYTDAEGNIEFSFTMPEALTKWKLQTLAHTKDLAFGMSQKELITQKQLMVLPNAPRFMREGDRMEFSAKISNLTETELSGNAQLQLFDATTNQPVDGPFKNISPVQFFTAAGGQSAAVKFSIDIPYNFNRPLTWRIVAKAKTYSDGEENSLPVLTNRMLVTESMPLPVRGNAVKQFKFEKLLKSGESETLQHHRFTVEFTGNPAWYAVQALPYLMEYPYECAEQTFNRYYANALASKVANASPRIQQVFEKWKTSDTAALLSNLQKNEELKSLLLQETPWVMEAKNENEQKKRIALLFDLVKMSKELSTALNKLKDMQSPNGGFVWFKGGRDDRYITQYILTGIGHLKKLDAYPKETRSRLMSIISSAIPYLDNKLKEDYNYLVRRKIKLSNNNLGSTAIQYLYMRSFFPDLPIAAGNRKAVDYYTGQARKFWLSQSKYMQGMIALALYRGSDTKTPKAIIASLRENSISNEEMGMYWKDLSGGYYWYQAPIESHALLIETFSEVEGNATTVDDLKTWLLKQKQTQNWKTTKATAEACYALLLQGTDWLSNQPLVEIRAGNTVISSETEKTEAGTGYFKKVIDGDRVRAAMGNMSVQVSTPGNPQATPAASWGAAYWQYFENLDKISFAATPLSLKKKLFIEKNTDKGPVIQPVNDGDELKVGDKIKVRIELRVDRDMEYVHMKDMRAACMEPVNVLSEYKWQGGLGYYETTKDAATNFFFNWLPKGTYVFEYVLFVTHTGNFSNGITTIQCMYAPEFTSHSEGVRVNVE
jgi:Bacterial Alpha-2-macroglobulin MG10 domain/Alpha-2-macroglobulin family/MG2 domain